MSKFSLDFKKFKKVGEDNDSATLRHYEGHEIKIAKKKLSSKLREHLSGLPMSKPVQKMAEGGNVASVDELRAQDQDPQYMEQKAQEMGLMDEPQAPQMMQRQPQAMPQPSPQPQMALEMPEQPQQSPDQLAAVGPPMDPKSKAIQDLQKDSAQYANELDNNVITPKTYHDLFASKDTLGKIGSVFGLMLGGMGAGLTHTENPVTQMWDKIITNDLEKQKANIGNKATFLKLANETALNKEHAISLHLGNEQSQMDLARKKANITALHSLVEQVKTLPPGSPQAVNAQKNLAIAGQFVNAENSRLDDAISARSAFQQAVTGASGSGDESSFQSRMQFLRLNGQEQVAKDLEAKHIPGVGQASREVPPDVVRELSSRQDLHEKLQDLQSFAAKNSGSINPSVVAQGKAKASLVQDAIRRASNAGVFKESEQHFMKGLVSDDPTQFFEKYRAGKGYTEVTRDNLSSLNNLKKVYGLPGSQMPAEQQFANMGGKKYEKVAGGWKLVQ